MATPDSSQRRQCRTTTSHKEETSQNPRRLSHSHTFPESLRNWGGSAAHTTLELCTAAKRHSASLSGRSNQQDRKRPPRMLCTRSHAKGVMDHTLGNHAGVYLRDWMNTRRLSKLTTSPMELHDMLGSSLTIRTGKK